MKQQVLSLLLIASTGGFVGSGCAPRVAPGDPEVPRKTVYTRAEIDALKAEGVSDRELKNMGIKVIK
ncbi:hypothetical protein CA51_07700 [Rosistilla oblonga]|uniref:Uncharacterized protein n=1 Tax=Rosistilla oblonga TaxID=2527990 RepID=A0A518INT1_9BACT|nr:hypothetical protein [Rosistilla oblonga]QDV10916.1 hypothetical protein CA51_07700 [Rosistilla oblonga]QDV54753.1 hypothetical protein Mal33_07130 [Rosistilla oblonga]